RGSGTEPVPASPGAHASSSAPPPSAARPAPALRARKPRRENRGGRDPSLGQPSRGCTSSLLPQVGSVPAVPPGRPVASGLTLTEQSVNNRYYGASLGASYLRQKGHLAGETRPKPARSAGDRGGERGEVRHQQVYVRLIVLDRDQPLLDLAPRRQEHAAV